MSPSGDVVLHDHFARAHALLIDLGPANTLRVLGGIASGLATKAHDGPADRDGAAARAWSDWSQRMEQLATSPDPALAPAPSPETPPTSAASNATEESEEETDDEETETDEDDAAPRPRRDRSRMRRLVAGMFDVSGHVEMCRLREVNVIGGLGEVIGIANEQGIEETEWPIAAMTPDLLRRLTPRGGKYRFEWFGRGDDGARVGRGRSHTFKVQGDRVKKKKSAADIPPAVVSQASSPAGGLEQLIAFQRFLDDRTDREKMRQTEVEKHREELASKERIERMRADVELAKIKATSSMPEGELSPVTIAAYVDRQIEARLENEDEDEEDETGEADLGLPPWLQLLGINAQTLRVAAPFIVAQLQTWLPQLAGNAPPGASRFPSAPPPAAGEGGS